MLAGRLSGGSSFVLPAGEAEVKLAHLSSAVVGNVSLHPDNRTLLYKAELAGGRTLDRFIEEPDAVAAEAEHGDAAMMGITGCLSPTRRPSLPSSPAAKQQQGLKTGGPGGHPLRASMPSKPSPLLTAGGGGNLGGHSSTLTLEGPPGSAAGRARRENVLGMSLDAVSTMRPKVGGRGRDYSVWTQNCIPTFQLDGRHRPTVSHTFSTPCLHTFRPCSHLLLK